MKNRMMCLIVIVAGLLTSPLLLPQRIKESVKINFTFSDGIRYEEAEKYTISEAKTFFDGLEERFPGAVSLGSLTVRIKNNILSFPITTASSSEIALRLVTEALTHGEKEVDIDIIEICFLVGDSSDALKGYIGAAYDAVMEA